MSSMQFTLVTQQGETPLQLEYERVFAIGYAGRDLKKTQIHIQELEQNLGVPAPKKIPTIFQCGNYVLTQEENLAFVGEKSSGEVEYVIVVRNGNVFIGLGSDHTDRELEAVNVPKSKQICAKPICRALWAYEELKDHWDEITLSSWMTLNGSEVPYQKGTLADILQVEVILKELNERIGRVDNCVIFSGTVPLLNGYHYGTRFRCEMADPELNRKLSLYYDVTVIPAEAR